MPQVFIRHGDRTLADPGQCWPNDKAVWPCPLKQLQATTAAPDTFGTEELDRVYRYQFIPGVESEAGCAGVGQLTERGYNQQRTNGQHLRDAYVTGANFLPEVSQLPLAGAKLPLCHHLPRFCDCSRMKVTTRCSFCAPTTTRGRKCQARACSLACILKLRARLAKPTLSRSGRAMKVVCAARRTAAAAFLRRCPAVSEYPLCRSG